MGKSMVLTIAPETGGYKTNEASFFMPSSTQSLFRCEVRTRSCKSVCSKIHVYSCNRSWEWDSAPQFVQTLPERTEVCEGEAALLECRVEAKPKADARWSHDHRPLDVTSRASIIVYESTITDGVQISLLIAESLHEDQELYRCGPANELGTAYTQTQLINIDGQLTSVLGQINIGEYDCFPWTRRGSLNFLFSGRISAYEGLVVLYFSIVVCRFCRCL